MLNAWLRLLRVPNLFTVPGDPLAGFLLAWAAGTQPQPLIALCVMASLWLYCVGLITNDLFDLKEDARERPDRPLPSGRIPWTNATAVAMVGGATGLYQAFLAGSWSGGTATVLVLAILLYNGWSKRVPVLGPLNMGLCRGLSLLMGAALAGWQGVSAPVVLVSAAGLTLYVAAVTQIARRETVPGAVGPVRWLPSCVILAWFVIFQFVCPWSGWIPRVLSSVGALAALVWSVRWARSIAGTVEPSNVSRAIGGYLRGLLLIQAALVTVVVPGGALAGAVLVLFIPVSSRLARRFYAS